MSRADEMLKEKFGISTEGNDLEQVFNQMNDKWNTLDEDGKKELEKLAKGYSVPASCIYTDWDDEKCKLMMDYLKANGESGKVIGEAYKSILEKLELAEVKSRLNYVGIKTEGKTLSEVLNELSNYYRETKDDETIECLVGLHKKNKLIALLENVESEKELEKLTKEFKAKDWI